MAHPGLPMPRGQRNRRILYGPGYRPKRAHPADYQSDAASGYGPRYVPTMGDAHAARAAGNHKYIKGMQAVLRKAGYNIAIDGVLGPMTKSALAAFHHGLGARRWNNRYAQVDDAHNSNSQANANNQRVGPGVQKHQAPVRVVSGRTGQTAMKGSSGAMFPGLDPAVYAKAVTDAEYAPQLDELSRQEEKVRNSGANKVAEMADMYKALSGRMDTENAQNEAARQRAIAQISGMAGGLSQGIQFGEGVGQDMAAQGNLSADTARLIDMAAQQQDTQLADATRRGGIFAASQAQRDTTQGLQDIYDKRAGLLSERGSKRTAARMDMLKWITDENMAMQSLGLDTLKTNAGLAATAEQIRSSRAATGIAQTRAQADLVRARKTAKAAGQQAFPKQFKNLSHSQRRQVGDAVLNTIGDLATNHPDHTQQIVRMINASLKSYGYKLKNPAVGQFALALYQRATGQKGDARWWGLGKG